MNPVPVVYQLRVVLRGVSPPIWRLLVRSDSTVADLHRTLQVAFGWSDEHLHRFVIHGRLYGRQPLRLAPCRLAHLCLHLRERFLYECDFIDDWHHDIRWADGTTRCALAADGRHHARPGVGRGRSPSSSTALLDRDRRPPACLTVAHRMLELVSPVIADGHDDVDDVDRGSKGRRRPGSFTSLSQLRFVGQFITGVQPLTAPARSKVHADPVEWRKDAATLERREEAGRGGWLPAGPPGGRALSTAVMLDRRANFARSQHRCCRSAAPAWHDMALMTSSRVGSKGTVRALPTNTLAGVNGHKRPS